MYSDFRSFRGFAEGEGLQAVSESVEVVAVDPKRECEEGWRSIFFEYDPKGGSCNFNVLPLALLGILIIGGVALK